MGELWVPHENADKHSRTPDLGPGHQLVSLVCFMWNIQHYVAFCRRRTEPSKCIFFNDLPALTRGVEREMPWSDVPSICGKYGLAPRLALYEARSAAAATF